MRTVDEARALVNKGTRYFHDSMNLYCVVRVSEGQPFIDLENCWTGKVERRLAIRELLGLHPIRG